MQGPPQVLLTRFALLQSSYIYCLCLYLDRKTQITHKYITLDLHHNTDIALTPKDIANLTYRERLEELNGKTPIQWLLEELKNNGFRPQYYPESGHLERLAYIHPKSLILWKQNPDILLLDCTYKTNRFNMPLLNICAITGNNMVIQARLGTTTSTPYWTK
jgi:hypothetical protein